MAGNEFLEVETDDTPDDEIAPVDTVGEANDEAAIDEQAEQTEDDLPDKVKEILKRNREELKAEKRARRDAERKLAGKDAASEGTTETADRYKKLLVNSAAKSALLEAGFEGKAERFIKLLDTADLEVNDDGTIEGLDDQIDELKEDYPDFFNVKPVRRPKLDASPKGKPAEKPTSAEQIARALVGR